MFTFTITKFIGVNRQVLGETETFFFFFFTVKNFRFDITLIERRLTYHLKTLE